jgi:hypothetical protein
MRSTREKMQFLAQPFKFCKKGAPNKQKRGKSQKCPVPLGRNTTSCPGIEEHHLLATPLGRSLVSSVHSTAGFEPTTIAWEAKVLGLETISACGRNRFEPRTLLLTHCRRSRILKRDLIFMYLSGQKCVSHPLHWAECKQDWAFSLLFLAFLGAFFTKNEKVELKSSIFHESRTFWASIKFNNRVSHSLYQ